MSRQFHSVAVLHDTLNTVGGGEKVCLAVVESLLEAGFKVTLLTTERTDWSRLQKLYGIHKFESENFCESLAVPFGIKPNFFGLYRRIFVGSYISLRYSNRFDLMINTLGDFMPPGYDLTYLHFPMFLHVKSEDKKYTENRAWRLYLWPYSLYQQMFYPKYIQRGKILCNSRFTFLALKSAFPNVDERILYPPFDTDFIVHSTDEEKEKQRSDIVVTCSRFVPRKNMEIIPRIASISPNIQFHIFGGTNQYSGPVIEKILSEKQRLGCTNLHLHPDASTEELVSMYKRAKVYLHTMVNEHFGISIVEAMAAGLVPIVHRSGGAYLDIIEKDKYGFSYETPEEAAGIIKSVIEDSTKHREYSHAALDRSRLFTKERFKREFLKALEELTSKT